MSTPATQPTTERSRYRDGWLAETRLPSVTPDSTRSPAHDTGGGPAASAGEDTRWRAGARRDQSAQARLSAADERDVIAHTRDLQALARDQASDARNLKLAQRDAADEHNNGARTVSGSEVIVLAAAKRKRAARLRAQAAEQDARAAEDRHAAATDREQAALQRVHALVDRERLADALALAANDALTGARVRAAGLVELDRELDRCRRTNGQLAVAYVDVIGLKALNDSAGHSAGDELLERVVTHIRSHLRSYDLIIRVGGDEFVCAMSDMTLLDARQRFHDVAATLTAEPQAGAIRSGLAQLTAHDTAAQLIARADRELLDSPHTNH
jgi:diguanylate cyclase (GGDEF)-like protein